ncbi:hypothetical protein, partial [Staphylococcus aureus]|uniref:hypothetical protein n=1 Tax=Staphylococcus aureus TaxID=1280 RepID=UPI001C2E553F
MWTFTFEQVHCAWHYPRIWNKFCIDWRTVVPEDCGGVRVVQMHKRHGFHYHCLITHYIDARRMWRLCRKHGMGMIDVQLVRDPVESKNYLSRYLTDENREQNKFPIRLRRWGGLFSYPCVNVADLVSTYWNKEVIQYAAKFWPKDNMLTEALGRFRACTWSSGDWHSLICLIDYREK